jgi:putative membrane protein
MLENRVKKTLKALVLTLAAACVVSAHAQANPPTDAQIAAIVVTANQVDIDAGNFAKNRSSSKEVQAFAQLMVTDHGGVNKAATELVTKLKVKPEENPTSASLKKGGEDNLAKLKTLKGEAFDKAYVDHEVAYHQAVLDAMDKTLIPNAKNEELKGLLVKVRPAFVAHLEHARHLQAKLGKSGG